MARQLLTQALLLLSILSPVLSVKVPSDLPEGLYTIPLTSSDVDVEATPVFQSTSATLSRRQNRPSLPQTTVTCGTGGRININEFQVAKENLQDACDTEQVFPADTAIVYTTGSAIAYLCNYGSANRCWRQEYEEAMQAVVRRCGNGFGGEAYVGAYLKAYGGDNNGGEICL